MDSRPRQHGLALILDLLQPRRFDLQPCSESEAQLQRRDFAKSWLNLEALMRSSGADEPGKSDGVPGLGPARLLRVQLERWEGIRHGLLRSVRRHAWRGRPIREFGQPGWACPVLSRLGKAVVCGSSIVLCPLSRPPGSSIIFHPTKPYFSAPPSERALNCNPSCGPYKIKAQNGNQYWRSRVESSQRRQRWSKRRRREALVGQCWDGKVQYGSLSANENLDNQASRFL